MTDYYLGETIQLTGSFKDSTGALIDPDDGTVTLNIYDPNGLAMETSATPTKRSAPKGTFDYWYDVPDDAVAGVWLHEWLGEVTTSERTWKVKGTKEFLVQIPVVQDP